jgi:hypothetical protein
MGGLSEDKMPSDDVYSWDLKNDRVTRRNNMPDRISRMKVVD